MTGCKMPMTLHRLLLTGVTLIAAFIETEGCGAYYREHSGDIKSPNYPNQYGNNLDCTYRIEVPTIFSVNITFVEFNVEASYDWLEVSCSLGSPMTLQRYSGRQLPSPLAIHSCSQITLTLHSGYYRYQRQTRFYLRYQFHSVYSGCGGNYSDPFGNIASPKYPSVYDNNLDCHYYIQVPPQHSVNVMFLAFGTEQCCDWLQINCSVGATVMPQKFRGKDLPPFLSIQSCSEIELLFHSNNVGTDIGFYIRYQFGSAVVGGISSSPMNAFLPNNNSNNNVDDIVLNCVSLSGHFPWWSYSRDGSPFEIITNSSCMISAGVDTSTYVTKPASGSSGCQLVIKSNRLSSANGVYTCIDSSLSTASAIVQNLGITHMLWAVSDPTKILLQAMNDDEINITCALGMLRPQSQFQAQYNFSSIHQRSPKTGVVSNSSLNLHFTETAHPEFIPPYVCSIKFTITEGFPTRFATNLPQDLSLSTNPIRVLYWPKEEKMTIVGAVGGIIASGRVLLCHVPSFPPPIYSWIDDQLNETIGGPNIHVTHDGTYTCTATNFILGEAYKASKSITVRVEDSNADYMYEKRRVTAALVIGVLVLLLNIGVILAFVWRRKQRKDRAASSRSPVSLNELEARSRSEATPVNVRNDYCSNIDTDPQNQACGRMPEGREFETYENLDVQEEKEFCQGFR